MTHTMTKTEAKRIMDKYKTDMRLLRLAGEGKKLTPTQRRHVDEVLRASRASVGKRYAFANPRDKKGLYVKDSHDKKVYIANPDNWAYAKNIWLFQFGAYGSTWVAVWEPHLEDALEIVAEWLADNEPGHLTTEKELWADKGLIADAMKDLGHTGKFDDLDDEDKWKVQDAMTVDMTYTESGYLTSYEWHVNELHSGPLARDILTASVKHTVAENGDLDDPDQRTYLRLLKSTKANPAKRKSGNKKKAEKRNPGWRARAKKARVYFFGETAKERAAARKAFAALPKAERRAALKESVEKQMAQLDMQYIRMGMDPDLVRRRQHAQGKAILKKLDALPDSKARLEDALQKIQVQLMGYKGPIPEGRLKANPTKKSKKAATKKRKGAAKKKKGAAKRKKTAVKRRK